MPGIFRAQLALAYHNIHKFLYPFVKAIFAAKTFHHQNLCKFYQEKPLLIGSWPP